MFKDGLKLGLATIIWIGIIAALVTLASIYTFVALKAQHDIVNPQVRQNMVDDPARSIAVKQDFHSKLSFIISADQNVLDALSCINNCDGMQLGGLKQIRNKAISDYNAASDNPDTGKYRDSWMPKHIDGASLPADPEAMILLQNEIKTLQDAYNKGA